MTSVSDEIRWLLGDGLSLSEIAFRLGVAHATVGDHVAHRSPPRPEPIVDGAGAAAGRRHIRTRDAVARLLADGFACAEIARQLGLSKGTVSYHARRLGERVDERCARRYDWPAVQAYYDAENLQLLCPNCHSQTDTFAGRKRRLAASVISPE